MSRLRALLLTAATLALPSASAHALDGVVASIKPVHSLVAGVMEGAGEPHLLVRGAASPHTYSLRPSDAAALEAAKLVFWVGPQMEVALDGAIETLGADARVVELHEARGVTLLPFREGGSFEEHEDEEHDGDDHDEEADHGHGAYDMHIWLDPRNAVAMVDEIEQALAEADPDNAPLYVDNARKLKARLAELQTEIATQLQPVKDRPFIVFHDGYQYFEYRFELHAAGSITVSPDIMPGAERLREIQARIKELGATCVFAEPQFEPKLVTVATEGTGAGSGVLDPLGAAIDDGPDLYFELMRNMAASLKDCLSQAG